MSASSDWDDRDRVVELRRRAQERGAFELERRLAEYLYALAREGDDERGLTQAWLRWRAEDPDARELIGLHAFAAALKDAPGTRPSNKFVIVNRVIALSRGSYPHVPDLAPLELYFAVLASHSAVLACPDRSGVTGSALARLIGITDAPSPECELVDLANELSRLPATDRPLHSRQRVSDAAPPCRSAQRHVGKPGDSPAAGELRRFLASLGFRSAEAAVVDAFATDLEMLHRFSWVADRVDRSLRIDLREPTPGDFFGSTSGRMTLSTPTVTVDLGLEFENLRHSEDLRAGAAALGHLATAPAKPSNTSHVTATWDQHKRGLLRVGDGPEFRFGSIAETLSAAHGAVLALESVAPASPA